MDRPGQQQCAVVYEGHVQGVGFRYSTSHVAERYRVTGYVKNCDDGSVELVAEGPSDEIQSLLAGVREQLGGYIRNEQIDYRPATGQFADFSIRH